VLIKWIQETTNIPSIITIVSIVAGEFGDEKLRLAALDALKKNVGLEATVTGALRLKPEKASHSMNSCMVRGALLRCEDWKNLVSKVRKHLSSSSKINYVHLLIFSLGSIEDHTRGPHSQRSSIPGRDCSKGKIPYFERSGFSSLSVCGSRQL